MSRHQVIPPPPSPGASWTGRTVARLPIWGGAFLLAAIGGEWIVHQLEYLIQYGSGFGAEMVASPHRLYMAPLGGVVALAALLALALTALALQLYGQRRRSLLQRLPGRMQHAADIVRPGVSLERVGLIALALLCCQVAMYLTQENLESVAQGIPLPGLAVLLSVSHWTVLPLHALLALSSALILAVLEGRLTGTRRALRAVEALVRLIVRPVRELPVLSAGEVYFPCLRLSAGRLGLRSPPLH
jgi:hypothetical protein